MKRILYGCLGLMMLAMSWSSSAAQSILINGAGATFPYPLYSKWFYEYQKIQPAAKFNYQSIGSGGGIRQIMAKTVDFGASDAPMLDLEMSQLKNPIVHIPTVLGGVVIAYNVPEIGPGLKLSESIIADIFLGKITKWNDPVIAGLNADKKLPDQSIIVVHRSDGSGTTHVFSDYLAKVSHTWKTKVGFGKSLSWPTGLGGKGNEGVTGLVKQTPGSLGYVELGYAVQNKIPMAHVQNRAGKFIEPTIASVSAAAAGVKLPADFRASITDPDGADAYPIAAFTYLLVYKQQADAVKGKYLVEFLKWALHDGQKLAPALHYSPLPPAVVTKVEAAIGEIKVGQ